MIRVTLKGLAARPLRTALTMLAIVIGVAFVSAAYTLTDTLRGAADSLTSSAYDGTDAVVGARTTFKASSTSDVTAKAPTIPASALASVRRAPGVAAAVFPRGAERAVYNNALLERELGPAARAAALDAMEATYAAASVGRFAAWVHESDAALRDDVLARGYILDTSTRAMAMALDEARLPRPDVDLGPAAEWAEYVRYLEAVGGPPGLLAGVDPDRFHLRIARLDGETAATALAFDHDGDRGIYNVSTVARARRRGLATALAGVLLHDAAARGCRTASLQATEPAEGIYRALGFRDLGRFLEFVPRRT
jgi:ribosomal protein S18 acetylase RimI-like enzyme